MTHKELKALRLKLGLSLADAAKQVHLSVRSWSRYEAGTRRLPEGVAHLFCVQNGVEYKGK